MDHSNEDSISLPEKGILALEFFETKIDEKIKEDLDKIFKTEIIIKKKETQVVSEYFEKENNQFNVNLKLVENEETLFSLYLNVASVTQAESICNTWKTHPDKIYQGIVNMFILE